MAFEQALEGMSVRVERILSILAERRRSLDVPEATEWNALSLARWQMLGALNSFVCYKKRQILEPLMRSETPALAERARALEATNDRLRHIYEQFVTHWSLNNPALAEIPYRAAALEMAARIERQVVGDVQEIDELVRMANAVSTR